jgi:YD repeat-containing protein
MDAIKGGLLTILFCVLLVDWVSADSQIYTYDALGRLSGVTYNNGIAVVYSYDAAGNRSAVTTPPSGPGVPSFTNITATSATVNWAAAADNVGVTSYEYQLNSGAWVNVGNVLTVGLTGLTYSTTTTTTTYTVAVHAKDAAGNIGPASTNSFATLVPPPPSAPGVPSFINITTTSATVNWAYATDSVGVSSYEYQLNSGAWVNVGNVLTVGLTGLTYSTTTTPTTYTVAVHAKDAAGNIGPASTNSFTTLVPPPPSAPGVPSFTNITTTSATVNWGNATDSIGVSSYEYQLNSGTWVSVGTLQTAGLTGLAPSTTYTVAVHAKDAAGNTGQASSNSFTTPAAVTDTLPWVNGSTINLCAGQFATPSQTFSFSITGGSEVVTDSPSNNAYFVTNTGWTSGTVVGAGTYSTTVSVNAAGTVPLTITFAGTGHTSTATVVAVTKQTCP